MTARVCHSQPPAREVNFDGLVGPTHHYAGLSIGNVASESHRYQVSCPRQAALEGLAKMRWLMDRGHIQAVLPPQPRPAIHVLRRLGFIGSDAEILLAAHQRAPDLLHAVTSASSMWAANAATISPSPDTADHRVHITPANLIAQFHRSLETQHTAKIIRAIFNAPAHFAHHDPLPASPRFGDEGAANHLRLAPDHHTPGLEIFVFGDDPAAHRPPRRYVPRYSLDAAKAIARLHQIDPLHTLYVQQNPHAIDAGVFHNDVIALAHKNILFYHEHAFVRDSDAVAQIARRYQQITGDDLWLIKVLEQQVPLKTAVATYLFNSQLLTVSDRLNTLLCPTECQDDPAVRRYLDHLVEGNNPIHRVAFIPVRQSMNNGGGPACLRLRVVLTDDQFASVHPGVILNLQLHGDLVAWVKRHYRETLCTEELADPALADESAVALAELYADILKLPRYLLTASTVTV